MILGLKRLSTARLQSRLSAWLERSLANRIVLRSQLIAFAVLLVSGLIYYPITVSYVQEASALKLHLVATRFAQKLDAELGRIVGEGEKVARLSLVKNALGGRTGSESYLIPFLSEYHINLREVSLPALIDDNGRVLAGTVAPEALALLGEESFKAEEITIHFNSALDPNRLYLHFPVVFQGEDLVRGLMVSQVDLKTLLDRLLSEAKAVDDLPLNIRLRSSTNDLGLLHKEFEGWETSPVLIPVGVMIPGLKPLHLLVEASTDPLLIYRPLLWVTLLLFVSISAVFVVGIALSKRIAAREIEQLRDLGQRAMEIANSGTDGLKELAVVGRDEIGSIAKAFNEMVCTLRCVYEQQEERVAERTHALREAREHLRSVLDGIDDVVYAIRRDDLNIDYVSASSQRVLGIEASELQRSTRLFFNMVLEEDRAWLLAALEDLKPGQINEIRYRIRHADGRIRLVLNRMNLILDSQGELNRVGGLIRDITDAVEAETMLHLRERALASASCGVVISDMLQPGQPIIYVNASFEQMTGYSAVEVMGMNCKFLQHQDEMHQDAIQSLRSAIGRGESCKVVLRNWRKDGTPFWNELQLSPLLDDNGVVTHYIGIQNDISSTIASTQALVESEQRLMLTVDALHEGIWDWSIPDNMLVTSPSWAHVLGLDPETLKRKHPLSTFMDRLSPDWQSKLKAALAEHFAGNTDNFYLEHQCHLPDGRVIWAASHGRVVEFDDAGKPLRMVGSIVDITERIESTERIIGLMSQLDVILTLSPDGIVYFDQAGGISFVNRAFEQMTGIKAGDATGLTRLQLDRLLRERADPRHPFPECFFTERCSCGMYQSGSDCLLYMNTPRASVLQISVHEPAEGNAIVIYLHDVTRETEVDRMKSEFLSTAAHELRTPMTSILGYVELLRMREFDREAALRVYDTIHRQARRLTELINELLDLARIEARRGNVFNMQEIAPLEFLREAIAAMKAMGGEAGLERLIVHLDQDMPNIYGDSTKLQQACMNIISNAFKYSPNGGAVEIYANEAAHGSQTGIVIRVRDHGIGMAPEDISRVFERFFRADGSGNIPGTGLGMSLVKEIIDAHHGNIVVDSELGSGTIVSLWLPLGSAPENLSELGTQTNLSSTHLSEMTLWMEGQ